MTWSRPVSRLALALLAAIALSACGGAAADTGVAGRDVKPLAKPLISGTVLDLTVHEENVSATVHKFLRSYADRVSLYGLRGSDDVLQATLEVSRFRRAATLDDPKIRQGLVTHIGEVTPETIRVDDVAVQYTRDTGQRLYVWVRGRDVFVLAVRDDYHRPRDLLRQAVGVRP